MACVSFDEVAKVYLDGTRAVSGFDLEISDGEFRFTRAREYQISRVDVKRARFVCRAAHRPRLTNPW